MDNSKHISNFRKLGSIIDYTVQCGELKRDEINELGELMDFYTYGWYVEEFELKDQVRDMIDFQKYIWNKVNEKD